MDRISNNKTQRDLIQIFSASYYVYSMQRLSRDCQSLSNQNSELIRGKDWRLPWQRSSTSTRSVDHLKCRSSCLFVVHHLVYLKQMAGVSHRLRNLHPLLSTLLLKQSDHIIYFNRSIDCVSVYSNQEIFRVSREPEQRDLLLKQVELEVENVISTRVEALYSKSNYLFRNNTQSREALLSGYWKQIEAKIYDLQ